MEISFWWLAAIALAALAAGVCIGRLSKEDGVFQEKEHVDGDDERESFFVGSPVSGEVSDLQEGGRPVVVIRPSENKIYAPVGGRIRKVFPRGNAFLFDTEFGAELYIRVGDSEDELLDGYYRPRIVQNEIVGRGKLLLEFDRQGLAAEGVSDRVEVSVETGISGADILPASGAHVRTGEELLKLQVDN